MKLTIYLDIVLRLRMCGALPLLPLNTFAGERTDRCNLQIATDRVIQVLIHFVLLHISIPRQFRCHSATKIKTIKIKLHVTSVSI